MNLTINTEDPSSKDANLLMEELSMVLERITGSSGKSSFKVEDLKNINSFFLIARDTSNVPLGCGSIRQLEEKVGEIKRMYSKAPGVGTAILNDLEKKAIEMGYEVLKLETRKVNVRAVKFYLQSGYAITDNYGKYIGNDKAVCFQKKLV